MLIFTITLSTIVLLGGTLLYTRTSPLRRTALCPSCDVPYLVISQRSTDAPAPSYEVLACPQCTNTLTRVHGTPSRFAKCPTCNQRTLETPVHRLAPRMEAPLQVEVDEHCHVCGHAEVVVVPPDSSPQRSMGRSGKVIPFRKR